MSYGVAFFEPPGGAGGKGGKEGLGAVSGPRESCEVATLTSSPPCD